MKLKKRTAKFLLKSAISLILTCTLLMHVPLLSVFATGEMTANATPTDMHQYQEGIVDGAVYYLRNVGNGGYLTVDGGDTCVFTTLSTAPLTNALYQQFIIEYTGSDLYRIQPRHAENVDDPYAINGKMYLCVEGRDSEAWVSLYGYSQSGGDYLLQPCGGNQFVILSETSNYTCALYPDSSSSNMLIQRTYNTMSDSQKNYARWEFVRVGDTYGAYNKYYIKNSIRDLYLSVPYAEALMVEATPFNGRETQQWKLSEVPGSNNFYLQSMCFLYDFITYNENGGVDAFFQYSNEDKKYAQELMLIPAYTDVTGFPAFMIALEVADQIKYLNIMGPVSGQSNTYELAFVNHPDGNQAWIFEPAYCDNAEVKVITPYVQESRTLDFKEEQVYVLKNTSNSPIRYDFLLRENYAHDLVIYKDLQGTPPMYYQQVSSTLVDGVIHTIYDMMLEPYSTYYFSIKNKGVVSQSNFSLVIQPFTISVHLGEVERDGSNSTVADGLDSSWQYFEDMNWDLSRKDLISAANAITATHTNSGISDFQSDVFVYNGHGGEGHLVYTGDNENEYLYLTQIPDMHGCKLAILAACKSAAPNEQDSMNLVKECIIKGAMSSMGWWKDITEVDLEVFLNTFWYEISQGKSIQQATTIALNKPSCHCVSEEVYENEAYWETSDAVCQCRINPQNCRCPEGTCPCNAGISHYFYAYGIVDSLLILGDVNQILYPINSSSATTSSQQVTQPTNINYDYSAYTLVVENEELGIKLYSRQINGVSTDDYVIEYSDADGNVIDFYKSEICLDDQDIQAITALNSAIHANSRNYINLNNLVYSLIDGEWHLIERCVNGLCPETNSNFTILH